jgi:hypothetical protein
MKSKNYYRVRLLARILFWTSLALLIWFVATSVWWVEGGYCIGSMDACEMGGN